MKPDPMLPPDSALIQPFLAQMPQDDDLAALEGEVRAAAAKVASLARRAAEIQERSAAIFVEFAAATGRKRETLLAERAALAAEREMLPGSARRAGEQYASALVTWARVVRKLAQSVIVEIIEQSNPLIGAVVTARKHYDRFSGSESTRNADPERAAAAKAELAEIAEAIAPLNARESLARDAIAGIDYVIARLFGEQYQELRAEIQIGDVDRERFVRSVVTTVERAAA